LALGFHLNGDYFIMTKKKTVKLEAHIEESPPKITSSSPLIFISHDTRDAELAEAFAKLIGSVSCGMLKSFRSSDKQGIQGIEYGLEWYPQIMQKLDSSSGVVCLLTERSLNRPWILYEAGVAKGKLDIPVSGIALGITLSQANTGPFAQFQNCEDDIDSLTNLVVQLLDRIPNSEPDREMVKVQVQVFIEKKNKILSKLGAGTKDKPSAADASIAKLFEEVKLIVQDLPTKLEGRLTEAVTPSRARRDRRFHPLMFEELFFLSRGKSSPIMILILFSVFREDLPWIYEMGREFYEAIRSGHGGKARELIRETARVIDMMQGHPMFEELTMSRKDLHHFLRRLPSIMEDCLHELIKRHPGKDQVEADSK
jgi:hypothetical protein